MACSCTVHSRDGSASPRPRHTAGHEVPMVPSQLRRWKRCGVSGVFLRAARWKTLHVARTGPRDRASWMSSTASPCQQWKTFTFCGSNWVACSSPHSAIRLLCAGYSRGRGAASQAALSQTGEILIAHAAPRVTEGARCVSVSFPGLWLVRALSYSAIRLRHNSATPAASRNPPVAANGVIQSLPVWARVEPLAGRAEGVAHLVGAEMRNSQALWEPAASL